MGRRIESPLDLNNLSACKHFRPTLAVKPGTRASRRRSSAPSTSPSRSGGVQGTKMPPSPSRSKLMSESRRRPGSTRCEIRAWARPQMTAPTQRLRRRAAMKRVVHPATHRLSSPPCPPPDHTKLARRRPLGPLSRSYRRSQPAMVAPGTLRVARVKRACNRSASWTALALALCRRDSGLPEITLRGQPRQPSTLTPRHRRVTGRRSYRRSTSGEITDC